MDKINEKKKNGRNLYYRNETFLNVFMLNFVRKKTI